MYRKYWKHRVLAIALGGILLLSGCSQAPPASEEPVETPAWMDIELTDVATGQIFKISDFKGKTVLLESFAVWCPTCLRQQQEMQKMMGMGDDSIVHISLDTDPNEDEAQIREHLERNDLNWYFAISPVELTNALIDDFGLIIISAPSAPVILICPDQSTRFLGRGIKLSDELLSEVQKGCT